MCYSSCFGLDIDYSDGYMVSGHLDGGLRLWSSRTGELVNEIKELHDNVITSVKVSFDSKYILTNSKYCLY